MGTRNDMKTITAHKNNTRDARRATSAPPWGKRISNIESEVRTVMGGISKNRFTRMALMAVLTLAMVFGAIGVADAAPITVVNQWPAAATLNGVTSASGTITFGGGSNRLLVVAVDGELDANLTGTTLNIDYGGVTSFVIVENNGTGLGGRRYSALAYLDESGIQAAGGSGQTLTVTPTDGGGNFVAVDVRIAVYDNVEQAGGTATVPSSASSGDNSGSVVDQDVSLTGCTADGVALYTCANNGTTTGSSVPANYTSRYDAAEAGGNMVSFGGSRETLPGGNESIVITPAAGRVACSSMCIAPVSCVENQTVAVDEPITDPITGPTSISASGSAGASNILVGDTDPPTNSSPWTYTPPASSTGTVTFYAQATGDCGTITDPTPVTVNYDTTCSATAPGNLADTAVTGSNVDLQWTADCANNNEYTVYRDGAAVSVCQNIACSAGTMTCSDTTVSQNTSYAYTVRGYNTAQTCESGDSNTVNVTTLSDPYKIGGCSGCHNSPPEDGARDGATGAVVGSHSVAQHTGGTCSDCHVQPTANDHRNGNIQMANPIHGQGTSYYDKDKSGTHTAADDVFAQVNAPVLGNCSNTYCHSNGRSATTPPGTIAANTSPDWGGSTTCSSCHGTGADGRPTDYSDGTPKANKHASGTHSGQNCDVCHSSVTYSGGVYTTNAEHADGSYSINSGLGYTPGSAANGGTCSTPGCHGSVNWGGSLACTDCHNGVLSAPNASTASGGTVTTRPDVVSEFGLAWGHKKNGRGAVTTSDCIVCHLEGEFASQGKSATYHGDGYIDLRNPDGTGEERITDNVGGAFSFVRYSVSYNSGSRTTTLGNTIAEVVTVKFCMACHDNLGAENSTARTTYGTPTAEMPFGGVALGGNYTSANDAIGTQGLIDVASQFASGNSSRHPVGAPNSRMYPYSDRLAVPYNGIDTVRDSNLGNAANDGSNTAGSSVVMVCDDCHTDSTTISSRVTDRTITAHGAGSSVAGTYFVSGPTLCLTCHIQGSAAGPYNDSSGTGNSTHNLGSGFAGNTTRARNAMNYCNMCHFSQNTNYSEANRPRYAQDVHGFNQMYSGGGWPGGEGAGMLPRAFMRSSQNDGGSWPNSHSPRPYSAPGITTGQASCGAASSDFAFNIGDSGASCNNNSHTSYRPAGSY